MAELRFERSTSCSSLARRVRELRTEFVRRWLHLFVMSATGTCHTGYDLEENSVNVDVVYASYRILCHKYE